MLLQGENRVFVARGLELLKHTRRPGIAALMAETGCSPETVSASSIGFMLAPRINAAGRMGQIELAIELFLTDDPRQLERLSKYTKKSLLRTMQRDFTPEDCHRTADIRESYIHYLLDRYGETTRESFDVLIENIKSYIDENLLHDFSMSDLSTVFNYNEKYLGRLFRQKTGTTIKEYCNIAKIKKAKRLLQDSQSTIAAIAGQVGYNNVTYFNRIFKRITGVSPQAYRNEAK